MYFIVLSRKRYTDKVGWQKSSGKYWNSIDAEKNVFGSRYSLESLTSKANLDNYKLRLRLLLGSTTLKSYNTTYTSPQSEDNDTQNKRKQILSLLLKKTNIRWQAALPWKGLSTSKSINQNYNPTTISFLNNTNIVTLCATKMYRCIKNRDMRVAVKNTGQH